MSFPRPLLPPVTSAILFFISFLVYDKYKVGQFRQGRVCGDQSIFCKCQIIRLRYCNGDEPVYFLKKLEKCAASSKPKLLENSEMFQGVSLSRYCASREILRLMIAEVVNSVDSFKALFR